MFGTGLLTACADVLIIVRWSPAGRRECAVISSLRDNRDYVVLDSALARRAESAERAIEIRGRCSDSQGGSPAELRLS